MEFTLGGKNENYYKKTKRGDIKIFVFGTMNLAEIDPAIINTTGRQGVCGWKAETPNVYFKDGEVYNLHGKDTIESAIAEGKKTITTIVMLDKENESVAKQIEKHFL